MYILVTRTIQVPNTGTTANANNNKKIIKTYAPFTDCISEINNTGIDNAKNQCQIPNERKNISQEFRLKFINETRNSFLKEIDQNEFISRKHNKVL